MASEILDLGIRSRAQGIRNPPNDWELRVEVPLTNTGIQHLESRTWNPESNMWNPESKTVMDSLRWGDLFQSNLRHLSKEKESTH